MEGGWGAAGTYPLDIFAPEIKSPVSQCRQPRRMEGGWSAAACGFSSRV